MMSISRFAAERGAFAQLKQKIDHDDKLRQEVEYTLDQLLRRFATSVRENRFVVGGVLEVILTAALRAAGVAAEDVGISEERIDIRIPNGGFSVKGHFSGTGNIRLINVLGDSTQAEWSEGTLFVLHGMGIGYSDPELLGAGATKREKDAIVLRYNQLKQFLETNPAYLISLQVPQATKEEKQSELVSRAVAREILRDAPTLWKALYPDTTPTAG
ncbi:MAG: hypothetical protein RQ971_06870 [Armatimonadota bacterium]|nr:hypothetical protein [Armatimonadota bacterium]